MVIRKSKSRHWKAFVNGCERRAANNLQCDHKLHRVVKSGIRPQMRMAHAIKVGNKVLTEEETKQVWPAFLEAQVSWNGPVAASTLLDPERGDHHPAEEFDDQGAAAAASAVREWHKKASAKVCSRL